MQFRRQRNAPEPEINLIAFIDILLVLVIFLMLSTTWSRMTELNLSLPVADAQPEKERSRLIVLGITQDGRYAVNRQPLAGLTVPDLIEALTPLAAQDVSLVISADAQASHQSVVNAMEAARRTGLSQITFATQSSASAATPN